MDRVEEKFWNSLLRHRWTIFTVCATVMSLYARYMFRDFISNDMKQFLIPWYDTIKELGGFSGLGTQVGNYQISYQTLIALMTYLPIDKVHAYKLLSVIFDYALGISAAMVVRQITGRREKAALTYIIIALLPITIQNSAAWGQCDSIFTFFLVMTFLLLVKKKDAWAMICFGTAFAFKMQAIFFLPFLLFYYVWSKNFSWRLFLLIPVPMLLLSVGGLIQGRSLLEPFEIYIGQTDQYRRISMNYPSFWNMVVGDKAKTIYSEMHTLSLSVTVALLAGMMIFLFNQKRMGGKAMLMTATAMMYTCVLFLPAMHERYSYPVLIFAIIACLLESRMILPSLGMLIIDLQTYTRFLIEREPPSWLFLVVLNIVCYLGIVYLTWKNTGLSQSEASAKEPGPDSEPPYAPEITETAGDNVKL